MGFIGCVFFFFFRSLGARIVSVLFLLRILLSPICPIIALSNPPCGTALTVSVSTVIPPLLELSFPNTVGRRGKLFVGGCVVGLLWTEPVGVLSSLL